VLSNCGANGSDAKVGLENLGSFWENEPIFGGLLRLFEGVFHGLACFFGAEIGLPVGLMLLNPAGGLRLVMTNVHLSPGECGSSVGIHIYVGRTHSWR
jgi:hypothetical protein